MAFPWVFESSFENTTTPFGWDSETDTASQLTVANYAELARYPWPTCAPFAGASCLKLELSGGTADAFLLEGDIDVAAAATVHFAFNIWFSPNFTATADDTFNIFELQSAGPVVEATFGARVTAATNALELGIGETAPTTFGAAIERGKWYTVELVVLLDSGAGNDGTINIYLTPEGSNWSSSVYATQVGSLDQAAVIQGVIGMQDHLATTTGVMLIDNFIMDDARIYPTPRRFETERLLTQSGHAFVGPGEVCNVTLMSGAATDNVVSVYDTDTADTAVGGLICELKNTANNELVDPAGMPVDVVRGCYVSMTGTTPRAMVKMRRVKCYSPATIRDQGLRRG